MKDLTTRLLLLFDGSKMHSGLSGSERRMQAFGRSVRREFDSIRNASRSLQGKLAGLGVSIGAFYLTKQSAALDKGLTQIGQTAGESGIKVLGLRRELFRMGKDTGQEVENLKKGFDNAVQSGLNFKEALPVTDAVSKAMAVTGAQADQLTAGLTVAGTAFNFDLAKPGLALGLLDRMTVAGRQGNAELENLSSIFARVGVNASRAGLGFDQTLGFIEGLSLLERQPERLATLADSTLRLFTNLSYLSKAQQTTGIKFFDDKGSRRNPLEVLQELKKKYDAFKTDREREIFMGRAFQGADLDTIKGLQALLSGDLLTRISGMTKDIAAAPGTIKKDLPEAIRNAVDQTGRLKATLREAADSFIMPFNQGISTGIKKLLDSRKEGGLGLSGGQIIAGSAGLLAAGYAAYRLGGPLIKRTLGRLGGTAAGIAEGKAIEAATGVTPVFITNWPAGGSVLSREEAFKRGDSLFKTTQDMATGAALGRGGAILEKLKIFGSKAIKLAPLAWNFVPPQVRIAALAGGAITYGGGMAADWLTGGKYNGPGWMGQIAYDLLNREKQEVNNTINIAVDRTGRVDVDSDNNNTEINLKRGRF